MIYILNPHSMGNKPAWSSSQGYTRGLIFSSLKSYTLSRTNYSMPFLQKENKEMLQKKRELYTTLTLRVVRIFLPKFVLEVMGGTGAIWGFSEAIGWRNIETIWFWRPVALAVGFLFFVRWTFQIQDFIWGYYHDDPHQHQQDSIMYGRQHVNNGNHHHAKNTWSALREEEEEEKEWMHETTSLL